MAPKAEFIFGYEFLKTKISKVQQWLKLIWFGWNENFYFSSTLKLKKSILLLGLFCLDKASTLMLEDEHEDVIVITSTLLGTL